jgi:hypothetical protein
MTGRSYGAVANRRVTLRRNDDGQAD